MNTFRNNLTNKYFDKLTPKIHIRADESVHQEELFPETIDFNKLLLNNDSRFFVAKVNGGKYSNFGINDNDILILNMDGELKNDALALVQIQSLLLIKKCKFIDDEMYLYDCHNVFMPMQIEELNYKIIGTVSHIIHNL